MGFTLSTTEKRACIDITARVQELVERSGVRGGLCHVYVPHATAAIIVNENHDPQLPDDIIDALEKVFPDDAGYRHDRIDDNAGAHVKAAVLGPGETVPVRDGKLALGTWQAIMLVELDGPRAKRSVDVTVVSA